MRELAGVAFLAETALVMFADEVVDAAALRGRSVVSVVAKHAAWAVASLVFGAYGSSDLRGPSESWEGPREVAGERESGCR